MIRTAVLFLALVASFAPAMAQRTFDPSRADDSQVGTRFKLAEEPIGAIDMRRMQKKMIKCTVSGDRDLARELLQKSDPVSIDHRELSISYNDMLNEMNFDRCMIRAMPRNARRMRIQFGQTAVRNLMAEEIYLHENREPVMIPEGAPEYLSNRYYSGGRAYINAEVPARLADCIVYREAGLAHAFLKANPTSSGETEAAESLVPVVSECLPGEGSTVSFTLAELRAIVADGLWSRSFYGTMASGSVDSGGDE